MPRYRKKLIEVALPLDAINTASAREKNIRHGHPSTLHLWWARRPLAAAADDVRSRCEKSEGQPRGFSWRRSCEPLIHGSAAGSLTRPRQGENHSRQDEGEH
jgi:hypothetical protein